MEPQTRQFEKMGRVQNPLLPDTQIIEDPGNHGRQWRLQLGHH